MFKKPIFKIKYFEEIPSTNSYFMERINNIKPKQNEVLICVANSQSGGRGRTGKSFFSPSNGLYFSFCFDEKLIAQNQPKLYTIAACAATFKALRRLDKSKNFQIKWVNDILLDNKKVCGILTEGIFSNDRNPNYIVIGIGINLSNQIFPNEIKHIATSLNMNKIDKNFQIKLSKDIAMLTIKFLKASNSKLLNYYKSHLKTIGERVTYMIAKESKSGKAIGINESGNLIIKSNQGIDVLDSGEIN